MNNKNKVFISYSRKDKAIVDKIVTDIERETHLKCWMDLVGIEAGAEFETNIIEAIDESEIVLFCMSNNSMVSKWTQKEVRYAFSESKRVVPINIDGSRPTKWFKFTFGGTDIVDYSNALHREKLYRNLRDWIPAPLPASPTSPQPPVGQSNNIFGKIVSRLFCVEYHPVVNLVLVAQLLLFAFLLLSAIRINFYGYFCILENPPFKHNPQPSQFVLIAVLIISCIATFKLRSKQITWLVAIIVFNFVIAYIISDLSEVFFQSNERRNHYPYPTLKVIGSAMTHHSILGMNAVLFILALIHSASLCLAMSVKKEGVSAWSLMRK